MRKHKFDPNWRNIIFEKGFSEILKHKGWDIKIHNNKSIDDDEEQRRFKEDF